MTPRKTAAAKAEDAPKKPRAPRATEKYIRNLRGMTVHVRLGNLKDPYRIELSPRGFRGDVASVPVSLQGDTAFVRGVGVLFEIITKTEAEQIQYPWIGEQRPTATLVDHEAATIHTEDDFKSTGRHDKAPPRRVGPNIVAPPGGDAGLAEAYEASEAANQAMPSDIDFTRRNVKLERTTEAANAAQNAGTVVE